MRRSILLFTCLLGIISSQAYAESVHEYRLDNGLKLYVKEDHRVPVVVSEVWYKVGSSYEPTGITGISHVLEHMMFKGTKKYGPGMFSKIIAENGGEENAFTSYDYTAYYQMLDANKLDISLGLEADRMRNLILQPNDFAKELEVVKEERRLRTDDSPRDLAFERFSAIAHVASPYHHPVVGWMNDLNHLTVSDLRKWYDTWYAPNNALIVVVGDVKADDVYELVKKHFGAIKARAVPQVKQEDELNSIGLRRIVVQAPAKLPWIALGYNTPVLKSAKNKDEAFALEVLHGILDGGDSARIPKELIRGRQLATEASASYDLFSRLDDLFVLSGVPAQGHTTKDLENAFLEQVKRLQTVLVDNKELARVKAQLIANRTYAKDSIIHQANEIGTLEAIGLSWQEADEYIKNIEDVTPEEVQQVANKYLIPDRLTIATLQPLPVKNTASKPNNKQNTMKGKQDVR
jgi:zinc protease